MLIVLKVVLSKSCAFLVGFVFGGVSCVFERLQIKILDTIKQWLPRPDRATGRGPVRDTVALSVPLFTAWSEY